MTKVKINRDTQSEYKHGINIDIYYPFYIDAISLDGFRSGFDILIKGRK